MTLHNFTAAGTVILALSSTALAQTAPETAAALDPENAVFAPENAVLDTSIPFAIGAREAQQELRSAYGWPTFQEGLVDGVYFRLDPDGYARFAPSPRLDTDVFEVICQPRTTACTGRKGGLSVYLGISGQIELKIEGAAPGDTFFIIVNQIETPLPDRILMPLDAQLETLLIYGGELIVRRGADESARISLKGFGPVAAYLRWIAADQSYIVLPRDWPVPGSRTLTETTDVASTRMLPANAAGAALMQQPVADPAVPMAEVPAPVQEVSQPSTMSMTETHYLELLERILRIEAHLAHMPAATPVAEPIPVPEQPNPEQLKYLTDVMGLDPESALMILKLASQKADATVPSATAIVEGVTAAAPVEPAAGPDEFVALSEYLKAVTAAQP